MAERPIPFHLLTKDELIYEVQIRDGTPVDTVSGLRAQVKELDQKVPTDEVITSDHDFNLELEIITSKLEELNSLIGTKPMLLKNLNRIFALSYHLFHRASRLQIPLSNVAALDKLKNCNVQIEFFISKVENLKSARASSVDVTEAPIKEISEITCDRFKAVHTLGVKYNGKTCVLSFLIRLEELCSSRGVTEDKLFECACELFSEDALSWYRATKDSVYSWDSLKKVLLEDFLPVDFDHRLLLEIQSRTQGPDESIVNYLCIMKNYFNRLTRPLSDQRKLEIVQHNIRPFYTTQLALEQISTWSDLKLKCRLLEAAKQRAEAFVEPPRSITHPMAGDLSYKYPVRSVKECAGVGTDFCVRCRVNGHHLSGCNKPRVLLCYRCGEPGYTAKTCPKCVSLRASSANSSFPPTNKAAPKNE